ncbi:hypothetical protein ACFTTN_14200 [Streptomyces niveus]
MNDTTAPPSGGDARLVPFLATVCEQDQSESPLGWTELPPPEVTQASTAW